MQYAHSRTALLIVDVQKGFVNKWTEALPEKIEKLQGDYDHIYAFQYENYEGSPWVRHMNWTKFMPGDDRIDFAFTPAPQAQIYQKKKYSCFSLDLKWDLLGHNIDTIHIVGIDTDVCISKTAVDFFEDNTIRPVVLGDYCGSHGGDDYHDFMLKVLRRLIGHNNVIAG